MSWRLGRPVFGRLPAVYRNDNDGENASNWLTKYWDDLLVEVKHRAENFYSLYLDPATAPEEWLDGMVAPMCGFTEEYYDPTWDISIKRALCLNAYSYIWPNRGAGHVLDWMLALHQIPTFPHLHEYYKPDWLRTHSYVLDRTRDLTLTGTDSENLQTIAAALEIAITVDGDTASIPLTDDPWYRHDLAYAIRWYRLPFRVVYEHFHLGISQAGDRLNETTPVATPLLPPRDRTIEGATRLPGKLKTTPLDIWIRVQPQIARDGAEWKEAQRLHDLYTPIYIDGGVCFDYFRLGSSALGDPMFDPVYDRAKPISLEYSPPASPVTLFERFVAEWGFDAFVTDLDRYGLHLRFNYPTDPTWQEWLEARRLIQLFAPWGGSAGWDYFRLGFSRLGDRLWDWLGDQILPLLEGWDGTTTDELRQAVLTAIGNPATLSNRWAVFDIPTGNAASHWYQITLVSERFGLDIAPCYDNFTLGYSHLGEPSFVGGEVAALRETLTAGGYTWAEDGRLFKFGSDTDLDAVRATIAASGAPFIEPCYEQFKLGSSRLGHPLQG